MHHESPSQYGAIPPCPCGLYHDITNSRQLSKRHQISQLQFEPNLEVNPHPVAVLPTLTGNSIFQGLLTWNPGDERINSLNQSFHPWDHLQHGKSQIGWETALPKDSIWRQTVFEPPSSEVPGSPGFRSDDLQSNIDSLLHIPILANPENVNLDSYLDSFWNAGGCCLGMGELESVNTFGGSTAPFNQTSVGSSWADVPSSSNASRDSASDTWPLGPVSSNSSGNDPIQSIGYQGQMAPSSSLSNYGDISEDLWQQSIDSAFQLDPFDDSPMLRPSQSFGTTSMPPIIASSLTHESPLSPFCLKEVSPVSNACSFLELASTVPGQHPLTWDSMPHDTYHNTEGLLSHHHPAKGVIESGNTIAIRAAPAIEEDRLSGLLKWQHISSKELKPHEAIKDVNHRRKAGRRHGRLKPETAKKAQEMRHLRACLQCAILKIRCTPGDICKRCSGLSSPSLGKRICTRAHLDDFTDLFFPVPFISHLRPISVDKLSRELSLGFVGIDMEVDFTCGYGYLPMKLAVSEFAPKSAELARIPTVTAQSTDGMASFEYQYPPPVAFRSTCADLIEKCRSHIKLVVRHERNTPGTVTERGNKVSKMVLDAVSRYHGSICPSRNTALLDKAMMLHAMYYFMATTLSITDTSKEYVSERLRKPTMLAYSSNVISRLLNRQIKSAMHALRREVMREVLEELERELKTRTKAVWAPCFCVALILCMCIEEAQIAMDAFTMHTRVHGAENDVPSSQATIESCRKLDDLLFSHLLELFHGVYKTHQASKPYNSGRVYNPIRDRPEIDVQKGLDHESADLVIEIRQIIADHEMDITERAVKPSFGGEHDSLARHMAFREGNSARLVSSFLKSFHSI